jgi:hypothetical protein
MSRVAESGSVMDGSRVLSAIHAPRYASWQRFTGLGAPSATAAIRFYRRHLTRFTPKCGRTGPSCSQIALEAGLLAGLVAFIHCDECRGRGA